MKLFLLLTLMASPVLAQATSQRHIPVRKETRAEAPAVVPAAPIVIHDTIVVYKTDSLGVFQTALSSTIPDAPLAAACHSRWFPIPIPIPLGLGHDHDNDRTVTTPVQATPEPGTLTLFGTGLVGLTLYVKRSKK